MGGITSVAGASSTGGAMANPCDVEGANLLYKFDPQENDASTSDPLEGATLQTPSVTGATLTFNSSIGSPDPGSAELYVPFDGKKSDGASATYEAAFVTRPLEKPLDLSGKSLFACIRLDDGFFSSADACGRMAIGWHDNMNFASSDVYGNYENLCVSDKGKWLLLSLPVAAPTIALQEGTSLAPDPTNLSKVLIAITTACYTNTASYWGNSCNQSPASYANMAQPATFHIDSIGYR
jgi:hypothetical protein